MRTEKTKVSKRAQADQAGEPGGVHRDGLVAPVQGEGFRIHTENVPVSFGESYLTFLFRNTLRPPFGRTANVDFYGSTQPQESPEHLPSDVEHSGPCEQAGEIPKDGS